MQYYTFQLDDEGCNLYTFVPSVGKYKDRSLPMELKDSPEISQELMEMSSAEFMNVTPTLISLDTFSNSWKHQFEILDRVLHRLQVSGFTVNQLKCD